MKGVVKEPNIIFPKSVKIFLKIPQDKVSLVQKFRHIFQIKCLEPPSFVRLWKLFHSCLLGDITAIFDLGQDLELDVQLLVILTVNVKVDWTFTLDKEIESKPEKKTSFDARVQSSVSSQ